ncbi:peptide-methionine (S)-S-oxide reductase [Anoxynatronum buryatiense]|uniref:peptide-methionine (S)-S-oxide reductase n=1 Tax=Anoxynatronum buryatiense TaxID=489973 RepID=A0AA45WXY4_9CLOT|nr:peptide-methionine (S)-S-oxide reductase [Anoxynatronum buryatiense]
MRTRVGYAGGTTPNPTYHQIGDHTETIQIVYDPEVITYEALLHIFWENHDPFARAWSAQYRSMVFTHDDTQAKILQNSIQQLEAAKGRQVQTVIRSEVTFYSAEDYHQKYYLQNRRELFGEVKSQFDTFNAFVDSTTAARVNGYLAGHGTPEQMEEDLKWMNLSAEAEQQLRRMAAAYW